jgi:DNA-binding MarR family transcriptional regulator
VTATGRPDSRAVTDAWVVDLEGELLTLLRQARRGSVEHARSIHPDLQLTGFALLLWLAGHPGARSADATLALDLDKGAVSRQITHLERLGLLARSNDPDDGRTHRLDLTQAATDRLNELRERTRVQQQQILASWNASEVATFTSLLRRFNRATDA